MSITINASNHTKCVLLSNQKRDIRLTLINLHPREYSQEFHYYPFSVKLDRCFGSCNTLIDLSNKVCIPNKTEDLNLYYFNKITGINGLETLTKHLSCVKTLTKHLSCECKCRFNEKKNVIQMNGRITINVDVSVKKVMYVEKIMFELLENVFAKTENI